ncbi:TetR/AcrR family transcriptional regulator [Nocardioides anomalus]|uniref:TetR/AcrR family transcriptional regulator n=1 Tax=Nocardioides anomalus TaxID=2712223 RepID=A0A6G6WAN9_9ACTN|nr:TetR/AcrR family transcriptional regulator [Nocardioides anomalus]QIG42227.1 TetR/AcrR family transcriptional regulator [Nocardioides anomalus]
MSPQAEAAAAATRPRVEGDRESEILEAALAVLAEVGYDRLTMDAVATKAKASKATLYRRWNGKVQLVIDALHHGHRHEGPGLEMPDTGTLRGDLLAAYCGHGGLTDKPEVDGFVAILTAISRDADFAEAFRSQVLAPKLAASSAIFDRAKARGEVREDVDIELLAPALAGIVLHRFFIMGEPPTPETIAQVVDQIILPAATAAGR